MVATTGVEYDVIIIGGGAAGLTAALFSARRGMRTLVISQDIGGQAGSTYEIENYPGIEHTTGPELMNRFQRQARRFGAEFSIDEIISIEKPDSIKSFFAIQGHKKKWHSHTVILTQGLSRQHLEVPGENKWYGKGVYYGAIEDLSQYTGKTCVVVGGGNAAAQTALSLSEVCKKVFVIHRRDSFTPEEILAQKVKLRAVIEVILHSEVTALNGSDQLTSVTVVQSVTHTVTELPTDAVFVEIGSIVKKDLVRDLAEINERGKIVITATNETSVPGLFAAGDVTSVSYRQIVISAGEGAKAAITAHKYLQSRGLTLPVATDWGSKTPTT